VSLGRTLPARSPGARPTRGDRVAIGASALGGHPVLGAIFDRQC